MKKQSLHTFAVGLLLAAASGTALASSNKTVVLVHGAFADGSSWNQVIDRLQRQHTEVIAVQLPLNSLKEDVAATQRAIARAHGDVVLVGHSWGGTVISEAVTLRGSNRWFTWRRLPRTRASRLRIWRGATLPHRAAQVLLKPQRVFSGFLKNRYARTLRQILRLLSKTG